MRDIKKPQLFISYCHLDEDKIDGFRKHLAPLKNRGLISEWYDRKIIPGQNLKKVINSKIENSDIICLFISANFLDSSECLDEKEQAIELKKNRGIFVIPIILSDCGWQDDIDIRSLLALPTDGIAISKFENEDSAWHNVYENIKPVIEIQYAIRQLETTKSFEDFLQNTELLTRAHTQKENVLLDDIFIFPELKKYDDLLDYERTENAEIVINSFHKYRKILIAGESQSGKTTLCKKFWSELRQKNLIPLYVSDKNNRFDGNIGSRILDAYNDQYESSIELEKIDKEKIVLIIDDFHFAKRKEKLINAMQEYPYQILIVDDIFRLTSDFRDGTSVRLFRHFKIKEFIPSQRNALIKKWLQLIDIDHTFQNENGVYQSIDDITELVDSSLGKIIGRGIMPAYPFFILMIISIHETIGRPLDQEITSQGHCYQALIFNYLTKQRVRSDEIDTYMNFLTELAFHIYQQQKIELSYDEFEKFISLYKDKYNLPIKENVLLSNLHKTRIFSSNTSRNYAFCYSYLYFFFVAKYLAENLDDNKDKIVSVIDNLHKDDNAYIVAFISHHSKSIFIFDQITKTASNLFQEHSPLELNRKELRFFDEQIDMITKAVLPDFPTNPEESRRDELKLKDELEEADGDQEDMNENQERDDEKNQLLKELRRSIKTVEVMGMIIKNRAGSLENDVLESIFESGMNIHLRLLSSFVQLIKSSQTQRRVERYISVKIELMLNDKDEKPRRDELQRLSQRIFWNLNFLVLYGFIDKAIHSLGSDKLLKIVESVCERNASPAAFLIMHGIFMWFSKNLRLDDIIDGIDSKDFSEIARTIAKHQVVDHCRLHRIDYRRRQRIATKLKLSDVNLLPDHRK